MKSNVPWLPASPCPIGPRGSHRANNLYLLGLCLFGAAACDSLQHDSKSARMGAAEGESKTTRAESRIGFQSWPSDRPDIWPQPDEARVLADLRRAPGGRVLLIDLPENPASALARYGAALRNSGYAVSLPDSTSDSHSVDATRDDIRAGLHFLPHRNSTRLEIIFIESL